MNPILRALGSLAPAEGERAGVRGLPGQRRFMGSPHVRRNPHWDHERRAVRLACPPRGRTSRGRRDALPYVHGENCSLNGLLIYLLLALHWGIRLR